MGLTKILHIDDDEDDCMLFSSALESLEKTCIYTAIHNPAIALELLSSAEDLPDVIFLDYNMPVMNGIEFLKQFTELGTVRHIPIIMFSTSWRDDIIHLSKGLGVSRCISKPGDFADLKRLLSELV